MVGFGRLMVLDPKGKPILNEQVTGYYITFNAQWKMKESKKHKMFRRAYNLSDHTIKN